MAYYRGAERAQYLAGGGPAIDQVSTRSLGDPTPGHVSLFTDIDRLQWGLFTDWGFPSQFVSTYMEPGSPTGNGSAGSPFTAASPSSTASLEVVVPPRVTYAGFTLLASGNVTVTLSVEDLVSGTSDKIDPGVQAKVLTGAAGGEYDSQGAANWKTVYQVQKGAGAPGVTNATRSLRVAAGDPIAYPQNRTITVKVDRADMSPAIAGVGGYLWGIIFHWHRPPLSTWGPGDDASSLAITW